MVKNPDAVDKSKSINKYSSIIMKAIKLNRGRIQNDWEDWKKERTKSITVTNIVETNFVHNEYNSTFNTQTLGKRNSKDSSKKNASARRKTKRVKLPNSDEDLHNNKNSSESQSTDENPTNGSETPPPRSPPNKEKLLSTPNKRNMHDVEIVRYLDVLKNCLKHNRVLNDASPVWTKPLEAYLDNAFKKERDEFKMSIMQEIKEDKGNHFCLNGFVDIRGVRLLDDKEILHVEVSGPPSLPTKRHTRGDTKKSLHTDILNLISILLDHLDLSVEVATQIKVFSFQVIDKVHNQSVPKSINLHPGYDIEYIRNYALQALIKALITEGHESYYHVFCLFGLSGQRVTKTYYSNYEGREVAIGYHRPNILNSKMAICFDCWKLVKITDEKPKKTYFSGWRRYGYEIKPEDLMKHYWNNECFKANKYIEAHLLTSLKSEILHEKSSNRRGIIS
ncbi:hypothetical protein C1645_830914 [Glomus cerebriforme]|uniref:Uncharacterized protein n=1 Tax=Glomus cerebriforme TaxID=658196 RepID=A0A397SN26_9GLOM|nr:hypothetical protein C1645_830914 [Glomus cerebriforme]